MSRSVVITGLGLISAAGANLEESKPKFLAGTCCLTPIQNAKAAHLKARYAGQVAALEISQMPPTEFSKPLDRYVLLALKAAREALERAEINPFQLGTRMGLVFATCSGPMLLIEEHYGQIVGGASTLSAEALIAKRYYSGAGELARNLGIGGGFFTVVTACSAGSAAIALANDLIRCGVIDYALAGGADALSMSTLAGFDGLKATSDGKCAPFSKPSGLNLGEAAAFVMLEESRIAVRRGAKIQAAILGSGSSNDAYHCSSPEPTGRGLSLAMQRALSNASLSPNSITYVNAHGTGTEANDKAECKALRKVFERHAEKLPVSSTKSIIGHCLGAAGTAEAIASIVCAQAGVLPSTANFSVQREGCAIDCVPDHGRPWLGSQTLMSNNSAFGGHNASIIMRVCPETPVAGEPEQKAQETIYITGVGVVSSVGVGWQTLAEAVTQGLRGLKPFQLETGNTLQVGMVDGDAVEKFERRLDFRGMDRSSRWATLATLLAIRDAGMPEKGVGLSDLGLFVGLSAGPSWAESEYLNSYLRNNSQVSQLSAFPYIVPSSVTGNVCRALRIMGHNLTLSMGPGAGLLGLVPAISCLQNGHVEALLCGATDELTERILADNLQSGFSPLCDATPFGEGAVMLMLETQSHAQGRGARALAAIRGFAMSSTMHGADTHAVTELVSGVLAKAGITVEEIGTICAFGPRQALKEMLGHIHPCWPKRVVDVSANTGVSEGAQVLLDLAVALKARQFSSSQHVLCIISTPWTSACAVLFELL